MESQCFGLINYLKIFFDRNHLPTLRALMGSPAMIQKNIFDAMIVYLKTFYRINASRFIIPLRDEHPRNDSCTVENLKYIQEHGMTDDVLNDDVKMIAV